MEKRHGVTAGCMFFAAILGSSMRAQAQTNILFVGNSFTHGHSSPVYSFNNGNVTDENATDMGGVPGIFKMMTAQAGLTYNVSIEAVSAATLVDHYSTKSGIIGQAKWNTVVMQEQSVEPLPSSHGGLPTSFYTATQNLTSLVLLKNPATKLVMYETWSSPAMIASNGYTTGTAGLHAMQQDLQDAYFKAYYDFSLSGVARVGDAFMSAVDQGYADSNPADGITAGMFNLWDAGDSKHASKYGSYLSAAVFYAKITGLDPRSLTPTASNSAAIGLGISAADATTLNTLAYQINALANPPAVVPVPSVPTKNRIVSNTCSGSFTAGPPQKITGNATISTITTAEGTFGSLIGATANSINSTNVTSSLGTAPASKNASVSGLTLNDGANNLQSGNFQFARTFNDKTRFFILESAPTTSAVGDDTTVKLIDASNNVIGSYSLSLLVSDFTVSAANDSAGAVATLTYTDAVSSLVGAQSKLGGVSFSLADLGVTDYSLITQATGLRLDSTTLDPNVVGMYTVPEPSGLLTVAALSAGILHRRRRLRQ